MYSRNLKGYEIIPILLMISSDFVQGGQVSVFSISFVIFTLQFQLLVIFFKFQVHTAMSHPFPEIINGRSHHAVCDASIYD